MAKTQSEKIEREYIIPLRHDWMKVPRYRRTPRAIKFIKTFLAKHMKVEDRDIRKIKLDKYLNQELWFRGIQNPPHKIKVKVVKENGIVTAELVNIPEKVKFQMAREKRSDDEGKKKADAKKAAKAQAEPKEKKDEDSDGVEDKKEEKEKAAAGKTASEIQEKAMAKAKKHEVKGEKQIKINRMALEG